MKNALKEIKELVNKGTILHTGADQMFSFEAIGEKYSVILKYADTLDYCSWYPEVWENDINKELEFMWCEESKEIKPIESFRYQIIGLIGEVLDDNLGIKPKDQTVWDTVSRYRTEINSTFGNVI